MAGNLADLDYLFIENVGNLVCPSSYDLGEKIRVALLSVTEGEDKPLKYPTLFNSADAAIITKIDIAEAVASIATRRSRTSTRFVPAFASLRPRPKPAPAWQNGLHYLAEEPAARKAREFKTKNKKLSTE